MSPLIDVLLFVTIWVVVISAGLFLRDSRRSGRPILRDRGNDRAIETAPFSASDAAGKCCLEVPCSASCAREQQKWRDRVVVAWDRVAHELGEIVLAGHEIEPSQQAGPPKI